MEIRCKKYIKVIVQVVIYILHSVYINILIVTFFLQSELLNIGGICEFDWQCSGTKFANVCDPYHGVCSCSPGYIKIDRKCYPGKYARLRL